MIEPVLKLYKIILRKETTIIFWKGIDNLQGSGTLPDIILIIYWKLYILGTTYAEPILNEHKEFPLERDEEVEIRLEIIDSMAKEYLGDETGSININITYNFKRNKPNSLAKLVRNYLKKNNISFSKDKRYYIKKLEVKVENWNEPPIRPKYLVYKKPYTPKYGYDFAKVLYQTADSVVVKNPFWKKEIVIDI